MLSTQRQCDELVDLMAKIQACVDRTGWVIPCRGDDFKVYIERGRGLVGVTDRVRRPTQPQPRRARS